MASNFYINYLGGLIPFNNDNLPERSYVCGDYSARPLGLTLSEICDLYWTVRGFNIAISAIDLNFDPLTQFLLGGGATGGLIGATVGLASAQQSLSQLPISSVMGRTKVFSSYIRKNRICKDSGDDSVFAYDNYGNIIGFLEGESCDSIKVKKVFVAPDMDTDESRLCVAGPIHTLISPINQGYVQINFNDIITYNGLYWPVIQILMGNGATVLTSNIMALGINQNNYNIGGINFCNLGIINMSGYTVDTLQPSFHSIQGSILPGARCCDRFYYDGFDRTEDDCYKQCQASPDLYTALPSQANSANFVEDGTPDAQNNSTGFTPGGDSSGGGGSSGNW